MVHLFNALVYFADKLNLKSANEYEYLKQSDCLRINDEEDAERFHELMVSREPFLRATLFMTLFYVALANFFSFFFSQLPLIRNP